MKRNFYFGAVMMALVLSSCGGGDDDTTPGDPCDATINITLAITNSDANTNNGAVTITATGGNGGFTYKLNQGAAQASNSFTGLAIGDYTVEVEDREGCTQTTNFSIAEALNASFATDIEPIIQSACATSGCHVAGGSAPFTLNGYNEISARAGRIRARTQARTMPPSGSGNLSQNQIDLIAAWVDAGAQDN